MARYFKYKTVAELEEDAQSLGGEIFLTDQFSSLFEPLSIGKKRIGNRLAVQPMEGCDGTREGHPDELTYRRYVRFGAGGAKLIWGEATAICDAGRMNPRQLWIHDQTASSLEKMLANCRQAHRDVMGTDSDLVVGLQLTHSGRFSYRKPLIAVHDHILDPLTLDKSTGKRLDASYPLLTDSELEALVPLYVNAARLCSQIGCDFVDLKQCHRYLLSELLAAKTREGNFGGSLENRTRLIRLILEAIRSEVPDLILATRMNAYDGIPYRGEGEELIGAPVPHDLPLQTAFGTDPDDHRKLDLAEPVHVAKWLQEWGISLINVSGGNPYANPHVVRPADYPPVDGYHSPEHPLLGVMRHFQMARTIQEAVPDCPVMGSGYSWLQEFSMHAAAANVGKGHVAIAGLGRGTLSHPDFAVTLQREGALKRKQVCRTFSYCTNLMRTKDHPLGQYATGCPPFDKEVYGPLWKEAQTKREAKQKG